MQIKKLLLVPFTILLGIFLGYLSHNTQKEKRAQIYEEKSSKTVQHKDLDSPKLVIYQDPFIEEVKLYKTTDSSLKIETIKERANAFKPIDDSEKFADENMSYWIELALSEKMRKGVYFTRTFPYSFDKNSFTKKQLTIKKNSKMFIPTAVGTYKKYDLLFNYDPETDDNHYYFHIDSYKIREPFESSFMKIEEINETLQTLQHEYQSYTYSKQNIKETIFSSMVIGMILMSALYTAVLFLRRRDKNGERQKAFIYYTLMQIAMALFLLTAPVFFRGLFRVEFLSMGLLSLMVAFFATLFTQTFLETKKYLPTLHTLLNVYLVLIIADMIWIFDPIMLHYKLYEFFALLFLLTAILRIKDGFKPAWFYLFGWIGLLLTIFLMDFYHMSNFLMYVGVFIEAVMLAWGLVFHAES